MHVCPQTHTYTDHIPVLRTFSGKPDAQYLYDDLLSEPSASLPPKENKVKPTTAAPRPSPAGTDGRTADVTSFHEASGDVNSTHNSWPCDTPPVMIMLESICVHVYVCVCVNMLFSVCGYVCMCLPCCQICRAWPLVFLRQNIHTGTWQRFTIISP